MERLNIGLSIVLPTINEEKNLRYLIPEIVEVLNNEYISEYEIIVVDDGSSDETESLISNLSSKNPKIKFLKRTGNPSLPMSIWDGIELSKQKYVMWLDADGSMTSKGVHSIIQKLIENEDSVIIGSRFVDGGGYKGIEIDNKSIFSAFQKVYKSEDSVLAVLLSRLCKSCVVIYKREKIRRLFIKLFCFCFCFFFFILFFSINGLSTSFNIFSFFYCLLDKLYKRQKNYIYHRNIILCGIF